jgi:hypothetical protein
VPIFLDDGKAIEGEKLLIHTRKSILQSTISISGIGLCFKYLCKKNVRGEIQKELNPKKPYYFKNPALDYGDCLEGDSLEVYSNNRLNFAYVSNYTSVHGIQKATTKKYGAAAIRISFSKKFLGATSTPLLSSIIGA